jgi:hypothetical protein
LGRNPNLLVRSERKQRSGSTLILLKYFTPRKLAVSQFVSQLVSRFSGRACARLSASVELQFGQFTRKGTGELNDRT